jgi:hypothetical protein
MAFVFTFLLVAVLESSVVHSADKKDAVSAEVEKDPDMCVGCDKKKDVEKKEDAALQVEVVVDPETGKISYIIKGLEIK